MERNKETGRTNRKRVSKYPDEDIDEAGIKKSVSIQTKYFLRLVAFGGGVAWLSWVFISVKEDSGYILAIVVCIFFITFGVLLYKGLKRTFGEGSDFSDIPPPRK